LAQSSFHYKFEKIAKSFNKNKKKTKNEQLKVNELKNESLTIEAKVNNCRW
jgi:hypothetical protein